MHTIIKSASGGLSLIGTGVSLTFPNARLFGLFLAFIGVAILILDSCFLATHRGIDQSSRSIEPTISDFITIALLAISILFISSFIYQYLPQSTTASVEPSISENKSTNISDTNIKSEVAQTTSLTISDGESQEYTNKLVEYFIKILSENTSIQAEKILKPYEGVLFKFSGTISDISPLGKNFVVQVVSSKGGRIVCIYFEEFKNYLERLNKGDIISGVGSVNID